MPYLSTVLAILPFVIFVILLFWKKTPLIYVSGLTLFLIVVSAFFYWHMSSVYILASVMKGFLVALDIFFIIFGAIFFLEIMKRLKIIENIGFYLESISKDIRVQVIFLAWFFENFLEGTAGFGTPSTVVAPLLIGLGISPFSAVLIGLLGNSTSVIFGAAGAPTKIGFGELATSSLAFNASLINIVGIIIPVFMLLFLSRGRENSKKFFFDALPFAIWSGIAFCLPSVFATFLGQEFPSILGSVVGLILVLVTTKLGLFIPKSIEVGPKENIKKATLPLVKVITPYLLLIVFLILGKIFLGSAGIYLPLIIRHTFSFFNPGFVFIFVGLIILMLFGRGEKSTFQSLGTAFKRSLEPFFVISFMSSIAQIMVNSSFNLSQMPSMVDFMTVGIRSSLLPLWAPIVGTFGSFITGSATVSNLMFGNILAVAARELGFSVDKILALALVGGAAGNMIALADVMAAEVVAGIKNEEYKIVKGMILPCFIYVISVGLIGLLIV